MNDDLLTKFMLGETSNEEETEVQKWIRGDVKNEKYFNDFKLIWDTSKRFATTSKVDENIAWDAFKLKREALEKPEAKTVAIRRDFNWLKIAAAVLLLVVAGVFYNLNNRKDDLPLAIIKINSRDKVLTQTLPDGSIVTLNKASEVTFPEKFTSGRREIKLNGEAFFDVTPDKAKPFIVETNHVRIRVVGTSFNVKGNRNKTEVIVESGVVKVSKKETEVQLMAKEKLIVRSEDSFIKEKTSDQLHAYYRTNLLKADNTPVWRIVEVLNEAYDANIVVEGNNLKDLTLSTTFRLESSLDRTLDVISQTLNIKVIRSKGKIILK